MDGLGQAALGRLLLIDLVWAHGPVIVQTIWCPGDLRAGRRVTRSESFLDEATLRARVDQLLALLFVEELPAPAPKKRAATA
jgi:hypothetical protein